MNIKDIEKFTNPAHYRTNVPWASVESNLKQYDEKNGILGFIGLNLDPDFQRGHVWTEDKQIAYVEYKLRGGEYSDLILFNHPNWMNSFKGEMVLVDGKQRLEAVRKFIRNELPVFGGNYLKDFDQPKQLLWSVDFLFCVNNIKTREGILKWYLELNSGGVVHTKEEIDKVKRLLEEEKAKKDSTTP
jgi:hypothetical protein